MTVVEGAEVAVSSKEDRTVEVLLLGTVDVATLVIDIMTGGIATEEEEALVVADLVAATAGIIEKETGTGIETGTEIVSGIGKAEGPVAEVEGRADVPLAIPVEAAAEALVEAGAGAPTIRKMYLRHLAEKGNANRVQVVQTETSRAAQAGETGTAVEVKVYLTRSEVRRLSPVKGRGARAIAEQEAKAEKETLDRAKEVVKGAVEAKRVRNATAGAVASDACARGIPH